MPTVMLRIDPLLKSRLDSLRIHRRETYGDIIERLIDAYTGDLSPDRKTETEGPEIRQVPPRRISEGERHEIDID